MDENTTTSDAAQTTLTSWCGGCDAETVFDQVRGGTGFEYACRSCNAAVFSGDLLLLESILQPEPA